jgi:hypothetical protein
MSLRERRAEDITWSQTMMHVYGVTFTVFTLLRCSIWFLLYDHSFIHLVREDKFTKATQGIQSSGPNRKSQKHYTTDLDRHGQCFRRDENFMVMFTLSVKRGWLTLPVAPQAGPMARMVPLLCSAGSPHICPALSCQNWKRLHHRCTVSPVKNKKCPPYVHMLPIVIQEERAVSVEQHTEPEAWGPVENGSIRIK